MSVPICCLLSVPRKFLVSVKRGVLQFTLIKPSCALLALALEAIGLYGDGTFDFTTGYLYTTSINFISVSVRATVPLTCIVLPKSHPDVSSLPGLHVLSAAFLCWREALPGGLPSCLQVLVCQTHHFCLFLVCHSTCDLSGLCRGFPNCVELAAHPLCNVVPSLPYLSPCSWEFIPWVLWWYSHRQSVLISALVSFGAIKEVGTWTPNEIALGTQDTAICVEMFLAAIAHMFAYTYKEFKESAERLGLPFPKRTFCQKVWYFLSLVAVSFVFMMELWQRFHRYVLMCICKYICL